MPARSQINFEGDSSDFRREAERAEDALEGVGREAGQADRRVRGFGDQVDRQARRMRGAIGTVRSFGGAIAGIASAAAVLGITRLVTSAAELGDEINNLSRAAGLGAEDFQRFQRVFEFGGASTRQFTAGAARLSRTIQEAAEGSVAAREALAALGVTSSNTGEALRQAINTVTPENFESLRLSIRRAFGEDAVRVFASTLTQSIGEVERLTSEMNVLGDETVPALSQLNLELANMRREIQTVFATGIADNADDITDAIVQMTQAFVDLLPAITLAGRAAVAFVQGALPFLIPVVGDAAGATDDLERALLATARASRFTLDEIQLLASAGLSPANTTVEELRAALVRLRTAVTTSGLGDLAVPDVDTLLPDFDTGRFNDQLAVSAELAERLTADVAPAVDEVDVAFDRLSTTIALGFSQAISQADSFSDALGNIAQRLLDITAEAAIFALIGSLTGQGGFGDIFTGLLGFRQSGGPVSPGRPYIVGERRPELFIPDVPGRIEPSLDGLGGFGSLTVNVGTGVDPYEARRAVTEALSEYEVVLDRLREQRGVR